MHCVLTCVLVDHQPFNWHHYEYYFKICPIIKIFFFFGTELLIQKYSLSLLECNSHTQTLTHVRYSTSYTNTNTMLVRYAL